MAEMAPKLSGDAEAIQLLLRTGASRPQVLTVHEDDKAVAVCIVKGDGNSEVRQFEKLQAPMKTHQFKTVEGMVNYLMSEHCAEVRKGIVFVGEKGIRADLAYGSVLRKDVVGLALAESEEFSALRAIMKKTGAKELHRLLITKLKGCIDDELLLSIRNIRVSLKSDQGVDISVTGLASESNSMAYVIKFMSKEGELRENLPLDWVWRGRFWECWDEEFEVPLRLELDDEGGIGFIFHPERLEHRLGEARLALAAHLSKQIEAEWFTVHEGEI